MKIKTALYLLMIFTFAACTPSSANVAQLQEEPTATELPPTPTEKPTNTPKPTNTAKPTETPAPLVDVDFDFPKGFAPFENQFPLGEVNEFAGHLLRCAIDSADFQTGNVSLGGGLEMRAWAKCYFKTPDGRTDYVNVPLYAINLQTGKFFVAFYHDPQDVGPGTGFKPKALEKVIPDLVKTVTSRQVFTMGFGFGPKPKAGDASQAFFAPAVKKLSPEAASKLVNGDTSDLPTVGGVEHFLPAFEYLTDTVGQ